MTSILSSHLFGAHSVRVFGTIEEPWFVGIDIAKCLEYNDCKQAVRVHVSEDNKQSIDQDLNGCQNNTHSKSKRSIHPELKLINEFGMYELIVRSKKAEAKLFQRWITREVLPSLRRSGTYTIPENIPTPQIEDNISRDDLTKVRANAISLNSNRIDLTQVCDQKTELQKGITVGKIVDENYPRRYRSGFKQYIGRLVHKEYKEIRQSVIDEFQSNHEPLQMKTYIYSEELKKQITEIVRSEFEKNKRWELDSLKGT